MAEHEPWLEEILRAAGDISPGTALKVRQAAEDMYRRKAGELGDAWAQYDARRTVQFVLAAAAADNEPEVQAAFAAYREAQEQADELAGDRRSPDREKREAARAAEDNADLLEKAYARTRVPARQRHETAILEAWRGPDADFVRSRLPDLKAADPARFKRLMSALPPARIGPATAEAVGPAALNWMDSLAGGVTGRTDGRRSRAARPIAGPAPKRAP